MSAALEALHAMRLIYFALGKHHHHAAIVRAIKDLKAATR